MDRHRKEQEEHGKSGFFESLGAFLGDDPGPEPGPTASRLEANIEALPDDDD